MKRREHVQQSVSYEYNGVKYSRLEDMPADVREHFIDRDGNGLPDSIDRLMKNTPTDASHVIKTERRVTRVIDSSDLGKLVNDRNRSARRLIDTPTGAVTLRCSSCDYDLQATPVGGTCPECGQRVAVSIEQATSPISARQYPLLVEVIMQFPGLAFALLVGALILAWFGLDYLGIL